MEEYKGFLIDYETSDHTTTLIHEIFGIKEVFGTIKMARVYADGILKGIDLATK